MFCYIHITHCITWPVTQLITWITTYDYIRVLYLWLGKYMNYIILCSIHITISITCPATQLITWIITYNYISDYIHITSLSCNYMSCNMHWRQHERGKGPMCSVRRRTAVQHIHRVKLMTASRQLMYLVYFNEAWRTRFVSRNGRHAFSPTLPFSVYEFCAGVDLINSQGVLAFQF